ncbi:MAG TPA: hypothetical protein VIY90_02740 [Steroidobacteraceae bacterium]
MTKSSPAPSRVAPVLLVDTHVHIYDCYDLDALFDAAARNFAQAAGRLGVSTAPRQGMLLLTETVNDHYFDALAAGERSPSRWSVQKTSEPAVLKLACSGQSDLWLVAGRQIATREDLEVLALGTTERFPDGRPISESLAAVDQSAAMTALPWGFGKWWGHRGTIIGQLMAAARDRPLYSGDNGGRLAWSTQPQLLKVGEQRGHKVLPGTDPLPFPGQELRVATYGILISDWDASRPPLAQLTARLGLPSEKPVQFGGLTGLVPFVRLQIAMQLRKRARRGVAA